MKCLALYPTHHLYYQYVTHVTPHLSNFVHFNSFLLKTQCLQFFFLFFRPRSELCSLSGFQQTQRIPFVEFKAILNILSPFPRLFGVFFVLNRSFQKTLENLKSLKMAKNHHFSPQNFFRMLIFSREHHTMANKPTRIPEVPQM